MNRHIDKAMQLRNETPMVSNCAQQCIKSTKISKCDVWRTSKLEKLNEDGKTGTAVMQGIIRAFQIENGISTITGTVGLLTINARKKLSII